MGISKRILSRWWNDEKNIAIFVKILSKVHFTIFWKKM